MTTPADDAQQAAAIQALADARDKVLRCPRRLHHDSDCCSPVANDGSIEPSEDTKEVDALIEAAQRVARAELDCEYSSETWRGCEYEMEQEGYEPSTVWPTPCRTCAAREAPVPGDQRES